MATSKWTRRRRSDRLILVTASTVSLAQLVTVVYGDGGSTVKLTACTRTQHSCYQTREIAPQFWGFIVTLISLTTDAWGFASSSQFAWRLLLVFVAGPIMPVWSLIEVLGKAFVGMNLTSKLGRSSLAIAKSNSANIIAQCDVLLAMSEDAATRFPVSHSEQNYSIDVLLTPLEVGNRRESEALVLLNDRGKEALLRANVLPRYAQLKFLQGYSGLAIAVSAAQATGYIFAVIARVSQGLNITPIERICLSLSFIVLVKAGLYTIASSCHHPLLLHISPDHEESVLEACKDTKYNEQDELIVDIKTLISTEIMLAILLGLSFVAIWHVIHVDMFNSLPSFFFATGLILQMIIALLMFGEAIHIPSVLRTKFCSITVVAICSCCNVTAYVLAIMATVRNWHASEFSVKSDIANSLPHIG